MKKKENEIDRIFQSGLSDLQRKPSADAWARLEAGLEKKNKKVIPWWYGMAAAVLVLALAGGVFLWQGDDTQQLADADVATEDFMASEPESEHKNMIAENDTVADAGAAEEIEEGEAEPKTEPSGEKRRENIRKSAEEKVPANVKQKEDEKKRRKAYRSYMADAHNSKTKTESEDIKAAEQDEVAPDMTKTLAMAEATPVKASEGMKMTIRIDPSTLNDTEEELPQVSEEKNGKVNLKSIWKTIKDLKEGENDEKNKLQSLKENLLAVGYED